MVCSYSNLETADWSLYKFGGEGIEINSVQKILKNDSRPLTIVDIPELIQEVSKSLSRKATRMRPEKATKRADEPPVRLDPQRECEEQTLMTVMKKSPKTAPGMKKLATRGVRVAKFPGLTTVLVELKRMMIQKPVSLTTYK